MVCFCIRQVETNAGFAKESLITSKSSQVLNSEIRKPSISLVGLFEPKYIISYCSSS